MGHSKLRYEYKDDFEWIRVIDVHPEGVRYLHFEDSIQGAIYLADHQVPVFEYIGIMAHCARHFGRQPKKVLIGGLGSGALLHFCKQQWHRSPRILTVESNAKVYEIAKDFFRLETGDKVIVDDLRKRLEKRKMVQIDLLFIDCYSATSIPPHLTTMEFMQRVYECLATDGCAIFNLWDPGCNALCGDQVRTLLEVFGTLGLAACQRDQNLIVLARKEPRSPWPGAVTLQGTSYPVTLIEAHDPRQWPEFMAGSALMKDHNLDRFFNALEWVV